MVEFGDMDDAREALEKAKAFVKANRMTTGKWVMFAYFILFWCVRAEEKDGNGTFAKQKILDLMAILPEEDIAKVNAVGGEA